MIIGVTSLKGGVGKTTTSVLLAEAMAQSGEPVVLLDADPEKSAMSWSMLAERAGKPLSFPVEVGNPDSLVKQAKELANGHRSVVIDTPPNDKSTLMSAAMAADVALVPLSPTKIDLERLGRTLSVLADLSEVRDDLQVNFLVTMYSTTRVLGRNIINTLRGQRLLDTKIRFLERYRHYFGEKPEFLEEYQAVWDELRRG